jgi:hypothetical protein
MEHVEFDKAAQTPSESLMESNPSVPSADHEHGHTIDRKKNVASRASTLALSHAMPSYDGRTYAPFFASVRFFGPAQNAGRTG